ELAAICMENPAVFEKTHELAFRLVREGLVDGLRIDHPDGLYDPLDYLKQLQRACLLQLSQQKLAPHQKSILLLQRGDALDIDETEPVESARLADIEFESLRPGDGSPA